MSRHARIESTFESEEAARQVAATLRPDNTPEMETAVDGTTVVTAVERETTGGLGATVDDYVVNLQVATQLTTTDGETSTTTDNNE
ncbi:KEOPS complex subunit Pcc1 [Halovenus salina]|uniref:KEOPS complex subunit Pcc1 n=1 Tax=Halovenus salina TaxID=1510225 RepID=A0ABD5W739_9EURY|nr:KEOPS complex subunit Pcc1 [Halovenus salina]